MPKKRKSVLILMSQDAYEAFQDWLQQHKEQVYSKPEQRNAKRENIKEVGHGTGN